MAPGVERAQVIKVRDAKAVLAAKELTIHPDPGFPQTALQKERHLFIFPLAGNDDGAFIPGWTGVGERAAQSVERLAAYGRINKTQRRLRLAPLGRVRDRSSLAGLIRRSGQLDLTGKAAIEPFIRDAFILFVKGE